MSSGEHLDVTAPVSLGQALLLHDLGERRSVPPREVRDELRAVPDHHLVARMAELLRDPRDLLAALERERREGVPGLVHRPVAKTRAPERRLPHALADVGDVQRPTGVAREDVGTPQLARGPLLSKPVLDHREHLDERFEASDLVRPRPPRGLTAARTPMSGGRETQSTASPSAAICSLGRRPVKNATVK